MAEPNLYIQPFMFVLVLAMLSSWHWPVHEHWIDSVLVRFSQLPGLVLFISQLRSSCLFGQIGSRDRLRLQMIAQICSYAQLLWETLHFHLEVIAFSIIAFCLWGMDSDIGTKWYWQLTKRFRKAGHVYALMQK